MNVGPTEQYMLVTECHLAQIVSRISCEAMYVEFKELLNCNAIYSHLITKRLI